MYNQANSILTGVAGVISEHKFSSWSSERVSSTRRFQWATGLLWHRLWSTEADWLKKNWNEGLRWRILFSIWQPEATVFLVAATAWRGDNLNVASESVHLSSLLLRSTWTTWRQNRGPGDWSKKIQKDRGPSASWCVQICQSLGN